MISQAKSKKVLSLIIPLIISLILVASFVIPPTQAAEPPQEIEELQQWVRDQGYNHTVAENWITRLSPEEQEALCGYKLVEAPEGPLPENIGFVSDVPTTDTEKFGQPTFYDAMALGYVTPVKNQDLCGSCWIFAVVADLESNVAIDEPIFPNFSEQEIGDCNIWAAVGGHNFCQGGNARMAINHLTQYGAADESCHPYAATPEVCLGCPLLKNVDNWRMVTDSAGQTQTSTIKNAILNYGPVYSTMYASDPGFSAYESDVYEYRGSESPNHAIQIIGWDDTLEHSRGTGAWMIKNSWGTDWGAEGPYPGCAWVAYGSANLGDWTSAIVSYANLPDTIFYHDECGWIGWCAGCEDPTAYGAVRFTPTQDSTLTAVDFWAVDASMSYEIKIFDTLTDLGGGNYIFGNPLGTTQTGSTNEPGYYSIPLDTPLTLTAGDDFIVQVKLVTTGWGYPIPVDYYDIWWLPPWESIATFSGESYGSCDGSQFVKTEPCDVGIRVRADLPPDLVVSEKHEEWVDFEARSYNITYTVKNQGGVAAGNTTTCIYIDNGRYDEYYACPALGPGASDTNTVGPFTMSGNSDNIQVCADNDDVVDESDEDNNCQMNILEYPTPDISVSPTSFNKTLPSDTTQDYALTISNDGDADLSYNISDGDCPWLSQSPISGTVGPAGSHNITVSINTTGLGSNYTAEIVIASNDPDEDPKIVPVTLRVFRLGDANGDGVLNAQDLTKVERMVLGIETPTPAADINQDGLWNAQDVTLIEILLLEA